ncbi:hypothetical protein [Pandoraea thiooxydans]|uniref:hypothetical protein n=1 Tax=Pandoraea thiooxydans TaxID=445709 RepID=UPI000AECEED5|nr:hypothetical protein [Pandoraea thiooxydans]
MAKTNSTPVPTPKSFPQDRASELALKLDALLFQTYGDSGEAFRNTHETLGLLHVGFLGYRCRTASAN